MTEGGNENTIVSTRTGILRFFGGLALVVAMLALAFALLPGWIHTWGATDEEIARVMPGDEILPDPALIWNHGITIHARPEEVWLWIAQIGDDRGGFYSYTFIENLIAQEDLYHNANRIIPEFQNPQPGEGLIVDYLTVHAVEPGQHLLAQLANVPELGWTWIWHLYPSGEDATRLVVRMRIQPAPELDNPAITYVMDVGGFVMERRMMHGIKDRAEGRFDPPGIEAVEIGLWVAALVVGLAGAVLFLTRKAWQVPLLIGILAVLSLLAFTFLQPPIWIRVLVDAVLLGGLVFFALAQRRLA
jgi:hypothetical protein